MEITNRKIIFFILFLIILLVLFPKFINFSSYVKEQINNIIGKGDSSLNDLGIDVINFDESDYIFEFSSGGATNYYKFEGGKWLVSTDKDGEYEVSKGSIDGKSLFGKSFEDGVKLFKEIDESKGKEVVVYKDDEVISFSDLLEKMNNIIKNGCKYHHIYYHRKVEQLLSSKIDGKTINELVNEVFEENKDLLDGRVKKEEILAIMSQESNLKSLQNSYYDQNKNGIRDQSDSFGLMQITPKTAGEHVKKRFKIDCSNIEKLSNDAKFNILCGALYIKICKENYYAGNIEKIAQCYNGGPNAVSEPNCDASEYAQVVVKYYDDVRSLT